MAIESARTAFAIRMEAMNGAPMIEITSLSIELPAKEPPSGECHSTPRRTVKKAKQRKGRDRRIVIPKRSVVGYEHVLHDPALSFQGRRRL